MFCPFCRLAMRTIDRALARRVSGNWENMNGTIEYWTCSGHCCDLIEATRLRTGVRKRVPGIVAVVEECDVDIVHQHEAGRAKKGAG